MNDPEKDLLEEDYRQRRRIAREIVTDEFLEQGFNLTLTEISRSALNAVANWRGRRVDWIWEELRLRYGKRPKRIELAIWVGGVLTGMCYGKVTEGRMVARIDRLERNPNDNAIAGFVGQIATRFLDVMALMCGCEQAIIWGPLPGVVEFYKTLGYTNEIRNQHGLIGLAKNSVRQSDVRRGNYYGT